MLAPPPWRTKTPTMTLATRSFCQHDAVGFGPPLGFFDFTTCHRCHDENYENRSADHGPIDFGHQWKVLFVVSSDATVGTMDRTTSFSVFDWINSDRVRSLGAMQAARAAISIVSPTPRLVGGSPFSPIGGPINCTDHEYGIPVLAWTSFGLCSAAVATFHPAGSASASVASRASKLMTENLTIFMLISFGA